MYKKTNKKSVVNTKKKRENNKKYSNKKKFDKNKMNKVTYYDRIPTKYTDIRNEHTQPFNIKFNLFGKIVYDKKEILSCFRLYNKTENEKKIAHMYYSDKIINTSVEYLEEVFKAIDKIKVKQLKYLNNSFEIPIDVKIPFNDYRTNNKSITLKTIIKVNIIKDYSHSYRKFEYKMKFSIPSVFKLIKCVSFNGNFISNNDGHLDYKWYFEDVLMNHKLSGHPYEYDDRDSHISFGYFNNYKELNRDISNCIIDVSKNPSDINKIFQLNILVSLSYKFMTVKNFSK